MLLRGTRSCCWPLRTCSASGAGVPASTRQPQHRARVLLARAAAHDPFGDDLTRRALREAAEVLAEARELAQQQTLAQLSSSWAAGAQPAGDGDDAAAAVGVSSPEALAAFWLEQGLTSRQAQQLLQAAADDPLLAARCRNTQLLADKLASLARVVPEADVAQLVLAEPRLLAADAGNAVQVLVALVNGLPGRDVLGMVQRLPRLLLLDGAALPQQLAAVVAKLVALHPSHSEAVIAAAIEDNPSLIIRMPFYLSPSITLLDELPIEIQNIFVLGGKGLGHLAAFWAARQAKSGTEGTANSDGA